MALGIRMVYFFLTLSLLVVMGCYFIERQATTTCGSIQTLLFYSLLRLRTVLTLKLLSWSKSLAMPCLVHLIT
jgi:hypothetical protein